MMFYKMATASPLQKSTPFYSTMNMYVSKKIYCLIGAIHYTGIWWLERILKSKGAIKEAEVTWAKYVPKIIAQAKLEKGVNIEQKIREIELDDQDG